MGGFTVGVPSTTDDGLPLHESPESQEVVSLTPRQLFALSEKEDPRKARFDLFTQVSEVQIKQLHEYSSTGALLATIGRLLMFVWYCYQRQHLGLETSPLEVLTVGHVFKAVVIEIFWWNKPPYLHLSIQNLDQQALCQAVPGLREELEDVAAAQGKKTVEAYKSFRNFKSNQWLLDQIFCPPANFYGVIINLILLAIQDFTNLFMLLMYTQVFTDRWIQLSPGIQRDIRCRPRRHSEVRACYFWKAVVQRVDQFGCSVSEVVEQVSKCWEKAQRESAAKHPILRPVNGVYPIHF
jgi:hypothetical protein